MAGDDLMTLDERRSGGNEGEPQRGIPTSRRI
jgi:hypothetical protein